MNELHAEIERRREELAALERAHEILYGATPTGNVSRPAFKALPAPIADTPRRGRKPRIEDIPQIEVTRGVPPVRRGELRTCSKCGTEKGCTAFARGSTVCRLCDVGTPKKQNHGGTTTATLTKTCAKCGEEKNVRAFWGGGDACRSCQSGKAKTGGGSVATAWTPAEGKAGTYCRYSAHQHHRRFATEPVPRLQNLRQEVSDHRVSGPQREHLQALSQRREAA